VKGERAVDFDAVPDGPRDFLRKLGFDAIGIDISADMLRRAWESRSGGD